MVSTKNNTDRPQSLATILAGIEKQFGKGTFRRLSDPSLNVPVEVISTGSLGVDLALGVGGLPRGRIVELYGPEASGKTTLALHVIAEAQRAGGTCVFIDAEHALDVPYARRIGVNPEELLLTRPNNGEQALELVERVVCSNEVDVVVIDSVAALVPKAELRGEIGEDHAGRQAQLMSKALRVLAASVGRSKTVVIFINQIRARIGDVDDPETTSGGRALKYYASLRVEVKRVGPVKEGGAVVGSRTRVEIVKSKVAAPSQRAEFDLIFGSGIARADELFDLGVDADVIETAGSVFAFEGETLGRGRDGVVRTLADQPAVAARIAAAIRSRRAARAAAAARPLAKEDAEEPAPALSTTISSMRGVIAA
jgi:recombination protein RecA